MRLNVATVNTVIAALKDVFSHHGIPETVMSDYLPQHSCALLKNFASEYGFTHITSSPGYSQENGEAERAVATVKGLPNFLTPRWPSIKGFRKTDKRAKERQQRRYYMHYRARPLPRLETVQCVAAKREIRRDCHSSSSNTKLLHRTH